MRAFNNPITWAKALHIICACGAIIFLDVACNQNSPEPPKTRPYSKEEQEYMAGAREVQSTTDPRSCHDYQVEYNGLVDVGINQLQYLARGGETGGGRGYAIHVCARSEKEALAAGVAAAREHAARNGWKMISPKASVASEEFIKWQKDFAIEQERSRDRYEAERAENQRKWEIGRASCRERV